MLAERTRCCAATMATNEIEARCGPADSNHRFVSEILRQQNQQTLNEIQLGSTHRAAVGGRRRRRRRKRAPSPPPWVDVTESHLPELEASCTNHILAGSSVDAPELSLFARRIVCNESGYTDTQRFAFTTLAGSTYSPPWIEHVAGTKSLLVSCGGRL